MSIKAITDEEIRAFMNEPKQRSTEVKVAHRIGYWSPAEGEDLTAEEVAEADAYLDAHVREMQAQALEEAAKDFEVTTHAWGKLAMLLHLRAVADETRRTPTEA